MQPYDLPADSPNRGLPHRGHRGAGVDRFAGHDAAMPPSRATSRAPSRAGPGSHAGDALAVGMGPDGLAERYEIQSHGLSMPLYESPTNNSPNRSLRRPAHHGAGADPFAGQEAPLPRSRAASRAPSQAPSRAGFQGRRAHADIPENAEMAADDLAAEFEPEGYDLQTQEIIHSAI